MMKAAAFILWACAPPIVCAILNEKVKQGLGSFCLAALVSYWVYFGFFAPTRVLRADFENDARVFQLIFSGAFVVAALLVYGAAQFIIRDWQGRR